MFGHFTALVIRHAFMHRQRHAVQRGTETLNCGSGRGIVHCYQDQIAARALHKGADRRPIILPLD